MWEIFDGGFDDGFEDEVENMKNDGECGMPVTEEVEEELLWGSFDELWSLYEEGMINDEELLQRLCNEVFIDIDEDSLKLAQARQWNKRFGRDDEADLKRIYGERILGFNDGDLNRTPSSEIRPYEKRLWRLYHVGLIDKDFLKNFLKNEIAREQRWNELVSGNGEGEELLADNDEDYELLFGLQKEYADAQHDLEKASKELEELISAQENGLIGLEPAIGWREARIKDAQQRMSEIEREMGRL